MIILCLAGALLSLSLGQSSDRPITSEELEREVRRALPLYMSNYRLVVSNEGSTVFAKGSELNRFSLTSQQSKVGEVLVFKRIDGKDWCLTMSQSAHATAGWENLKARGIQILSADGPSNVAVVYSTSSGGYLARVDMDQRGKRPNEVRSVNYLLHAVIEPANPRTLWGFGRAAGRQALQSVDTMTGKRLSSSSLPEGLQPLAYDPVTRRTLCIKDKAKATERIAIYHAKSSSMRLLPVPEKSGHYWMSRGSVYFQGDGKMFEAQGNAWEPVSDDRFIGKSANDKYWLLRRGSGLILTTFD